MWAVIILAAVAVCVAEPEVRLKRQSLINKRPSSGYIDVNERRTVLECAKSCSLSSDCVSLFYIYGTRECQRHKTLYTESSPGLDNVSSAVYWEKEAPFTVPPPFACPVDAVGVKQMCLPDGSLVKVRVFADTNRTFADVKAKCEVEGGQLYQITTAVKMTFSLNLMRCPAYTADGYWIDGVYNLGTDVWETSDGTPLPMTQGDFWYPDRPNDAGTANCLNMRLDQFNFLWDDGDCTFSFTTICDMP